MNILAIDTSTKYLSIAVMRGDKVAAKMHKKADMMHSTLLVPMIEKIVKKAHLRIGDIDGFCISIGPGSFTGLRIGVTTIKGLAYALKKPIVTVPTMDVIAHNVKKFKGIICPVLDARKGKVYACLYRSDGKNIKRISKYLLLTAEELKQKLNTYKDEIFFLGDMPGLCNSFKWYPRPEALAVLGLEQFRKKRFVKCEDLEPMYIYSRECDIKGR